MQTGGIFDVNIAIIRPDVTSGASDHIKSCNIICWFFNEKLSGVGLCEQLSFKRCMTATENTDTSDNLGE